MEQERAVDTNDVQGRTAQAALSDAIRLLGELVYPNPLERPENAAQRLLLVHADNAPSIELFTRLLTTGHENARESARFIIKGILALISDAQNPADGDDPEDFQDAYHPLATANVRRVWNTFNVSIECGKVGDDDCWNEVYQLGVTETLHQHLGPEVNNYPERDEYWRGMALLSLTRLHPVEKDCPEFIDWAGASSNARAVLEVAKERNTINATTLVGVMGEHSKVSMPLRNGAL
jgi:hypothetical protein